MTCATIRDLLLEAELEELRGQGDAAVAVHVRGCLTCRRLAERLVADTGHLAGAVQSRSVAATPPARRRHGVTYSAAAVLVGVAATVTVAVTRGPAPIPAPPATVIALRPVIAAPPSAPNASAVTDVAPRPSRTRAIGRRAPAGGAIRAMPVIAQRAVRVPPARAVAVPPVRLDPAPAPEPLGSGVSIDLPAGKGATILRTDRPDVTVVWIYSSRTQQ